MRYVVPRNNPVRQNGGQYRDSLPNPGTIPRPNGVGDSVGVRGCTILEGEKRGPFSRSDVATAEGRESGWERERAEGGETGRGEGSRGGRGEEEENEQEKERERGKAREVGGREGKRERERAVTWRLRTRTNPAWFSTPAA